MLFVGAEGAVCGQQLLHPLLPGMARNPGEHPLDRSALFRRFYQAGVRKEGSTGLGLALAFSVCERNSLALSYDFTDGTHIFSVNLKKSK